MLLLLLYYYYYYYYFALYLSTQEDEEQQAVDVVAGCQSYLEHFTWRHDSILNCLAKALQAMNLGNIYADIPEFRNPSILTGDVYRPDLLLVTPGKSLYIVELTVGYETSLHKNVARKREKYQDLVKEQSKHFYSVKFTKICQLAHLAYLIRSVQAL